MKPIKLFTLFFTLFTLTVNGFSQTPDRVLSAEEFRQQKIEEKRQQLKREIQVGINDRMKYGYSYGIPDEYIFLEKTYPYKEHKRIFEGKKNELKYIFNACDDNTKKLFFEDLKRFFVTTQTLLNIIIGLLFNAEEIAFKIFNPLFPAVEI